MLTKDMSRSGELDGDSAEAAIPLTLPAGSGDDHPANILLVDDREDKRLAMEIIIAELGQNVVRANSGKEALRCVLQQEFAVILLDVNMPGMDGFETALLIRQRRNSEHTPIIFVTGISDTETHVSRGYSLGAVDYILTPVMPEVLRTKVSVFVELFKKTELLKRQAERLRQAHDQLELRVQERTAQLARTNEALQAEISERQRVEEHIRRINGELEQRVQERTAELALSNQELEAFSYSVAHDLQAPVRNIESYAQLLEEDYGASVPPQARQYLSRIAARSRDMAQLVVDLLHLSHLGKQLLTQKETRLGELVGEVIASLQTEIEGRNITWRIGDLPTVACDPNLIKQVFTNLLANAIKYSQPRAEAILEIGQVLAEGEIAIFVRDNGVGFNMQYADKLFGVFQRLHPVREFSGTGVGLATVARIVRRHGGRVWAEGKEGQGAVFFFTIGPRTLATN